VHASKRYSPYLAPSRVQLRTPSPLQKAEPSAPQAHQELRVDPEEMATRTIRYMDVFEEHAKAIREHPQAECEQGYQALLSQNRALPLGTKWPQLKHQGLEVLRSRMEAILQQPDVTLVDHLEKCSAAQTLLHLQRDILGRLPFLRSQEVEKRIDALRAERRRRYASYSNNQRFRPLVARSPPPAFQPPPRSSSSTVALSSEMVQDFVTLPSIPQAVGNTFRLHTGDSELYYHVAGFDVSSDNKLRFQLRFEGIETSDIVDSDDLSRMLKDSELVTSD